MTFPASFRTIGLAGAIAAGVLGLSACTTTPSTSAATPTVPSNTRASVDAQVDAALNRLYNTVPGSRELVARSKGVLVFPAVVGGSFIVGAEYGRGALRVDGKTLDYYSTTAASIGLQAGAQSKAVYYVFTTQDALDKFRASNGWTAGVDATVAVAQIGANGTVDTRTLQQPVVAFVLNNAGLEAGVSLQGFKITKIAL